MVKFPKYNLGILATLPLDDFWLRYIPIFARPVSITHRFPSIFEAINELRMAISEKFTSADLDIVVFECDRT
jgi:hypothetical protein